MKIAFAIVAALLAVGGNLPYLRDILRGRVQPHPFTWLVWTIVSCVIFFGQVAKGAGIGALPTAASEIFTVIIFIFSLRYGFKKVTTTDKVFLAVALLGIVPWVLTKDPTVSVVIVVLIDLTATLPTIRKMWRHPETEVPLLYGTNVVRHLMALVSLQAYSVATVLHSVSMIISNTVMTGILLKKRK